MAVEWVQYKGKKILYGDYSGVKDQNEMLSRLEAAGKMLREASGKVLILTNLTDCVIGKDFFKGAKELGKSVINEKAEKHAIVGVTGLKGMMVKGYATFSGDEVKVFDDDTAAKDYLAG